MTERQDAAMQTNGRTAKGWEWDCNRKWPLPHNSLCAPLREGVLSHARQSNHRALKGVRWLEGGIRMAVFFCGARIRCG